MPHRPPNGNGRSPMYVDPGYDRDPLRPKQHVVLVEEAPGQFTILAKSEEPIETLRLHIGGRHAMTLQNENMVILDQDSRVVEERFENYRPEPQDPDQPINDHNLAIRDRWIGSIVKWLVDRALWEAEDSPEAQDAVRKALDDQGVAMSVSPGGCQVLFERNGETLCVWSAVQ